MKKRSRIAAALAILALAATPLLAVSTREVNFPQDVMIGDQQVAKGWYDLQWKDGDNGTVEVRVIRKGKVLATTNGRLEQSADRAKSDRVLYRMEDGKRSLAEIHTAGSTEVVKIGG